MVLVNTFSLMLTGIKTSFYDLGVTGETAYEIGGKLNVPAFYCMMQLCAENGMISLYSWGKLLKYMLHLKMRKPTSFHEM